ncbi:DNA topoisomerase, partial [Hungatella effluvii]
MSKSLYIAEKPSVAQEFANALKINGRRSDGYIESEQAIVTWCVGHLVTMSYPECYDPKYKRWSLETLPFLPKEFKYEVIPSVEKQFKIVSGLLNRPDVDTIYVCTDSGREGEYIYRLVAQMADVKDKAQKRVWIDSQTEEEILRGIREAKDETEYDNLSASAYLRAKEDYLMGINFSRLLTLKYGQNISNYLRTGKNTVISVGRVMTCVMGMVIRREREIRDFVKTPFYRVIGTFSPQDMDFDGEWKSAPGSRYFESPYLYKENGFKERKTAEALIEALSAVQPMNAVLQAIEKKKETKNPPLLYNLAELQNDCSKMFKISPDETLKVVQELYEKKLVTYPRTDARVLSTAVAKEIYK